eukprot:jgi/Botrbrau1/2283/Bobra.101_2s0106.1
MPRPRPKGVTPAVKEQTNEVSQGEFVIKLMVADQGPFGFSCKDVRQPVSWLFGLVQSFINRMGGVLKLEVGENPVVDGLVTSEGVALNPDDIIGDVLISGTTLIPVFVAEAENGRDDEEEEEEEEQNQGLEMQGGRGRRTPRQPRKDMGGLVSQMRQASMLERWQAPVPSATLASFDDDPAHFIPGHQGRVFDLAFAPGSSSLLASAGEDDCALLWQLDEESSEYELAATLGGLPEAGHNDAVLRLNWSPDGRLIATASADGKVWVWKVPPVHKEEAEDNLALFALGGHPEEVYACEFVGVYPTTFAW